MRILIVCLGNICRSPMADGIMRDLVKANNLDWEVDSAGTGSWHIGEAPDRRAIRTAARHGLDISGLRARQFEVEDFDRFDKIYAMDHNNYSDVLALSRNKADQDKVELFMDAAGEYGKSVTDPWFSDEHFEPVFLEIREACERILKNLSL